MKHQVNLYSFLAYNRGPWVQALCALDSFWGSQSSIPWSHSLLICLQHPLPLLGAFMSNCHQVYEALHYQQSFMMCSPDASFAHLWPLMGLISIHHVWKQHGTWKSNNHTNNYGDSSWYTEWRDGIRVRSEDWDDGNI